MIPAGVGGWQTYSYFHPTTHHSYMGYKGFSVGWSNWNNVSNVQVVAAITVPTKDVQLYLKFDYNSSQNNQLYQFLFVLPFPIHSFQHVKSGDFPLNASYASFTSRNVSGSSTIGINFTTPYTRSFQQILFDMKASGDLISGERGSYLVSFPSGVTPPFDVLKQVRYINTGDQRSAIMMESEKFYSTRVIIGISNNSILTSAYPPSYTSNPVNITGFQAGPTNYLTWNFTRIPTVPVTVQYQDVNEVGQYQNYAYFGGIAVAVGASTIIAVVLVFLDPRNELEYWARLVSISTRLYQRERMNSALAGKETIYGFYFLSLVFDVAGLAELPSSPQLGLALLAVGLGSLAVGISINAGNLLHEIRRSEIGEKVAMMYNYARNEGERIISDLEALKRVAGSATRAEIDLIEPASRVLLSWMHDNHPNEEERARVILNEILAKYHKSV